MFSLEYTTETRANLKQENELSKLNYLFFKNLISSAANICMSGFVSFIYCFPIPIL